MKFILKLLIDFKKFSVLLPYPTHKFKTLVFPLRNFSSLANSHVKPSPISEKILPSLDERIKISQEKNYNYICEQISQLPNPTHQNWCELKKNAQNVNLNIDEFNFTGLVLKCLLKENMFAKAETFFNFIDESGTKETLLIWSYKMALLACLKHDNHETKILEFYEKIKNEDAVYDTITLENIIHGLSSTQKWKEGLQLIQDSIAKISPDTYWFIAIAAFKNGDFETGFNLINEMGKLHYTVSPQVYEVALKSIIKSDKKCSPLKLKLLDNFLKTLSLNKLVVPLNVANELKVIFNNLDGSKFKATSVSIGRDSRCRNCQRTLKPASLTPSQFIKLKDGIFKDVVQGGDIFYNSTPGEVKSFKAFLKSAMPYDVVLDGLNIAYIKHSKTPQDMGEKLYELASYFAESRRLKVVVLGRKHMKKFLVNYMEKLNDFAHVYLFRNISKDDPFLLYAALAGGPNTYLVSRDMLRNHQTSLTDPELRNYFSLWRSTRQIYPTLKPGKILEFPPQHEISTQGSLYDSDGLHIPYDDNRVLNGYDIIRSWICLQTPASMR